MKYELFGAITEYPARNGHTTLKTLTVLIQPSQINLIHFDLIDFIEGNSYSLSILSSLFLTPYQTPPHFYDLTKDANTLKTLKRGFPGLKEAFLRSDNAGSYHCSYLILSLSDLGKRTGITISRYDFSDPQAGKDVCDRRIATVKSHMRRFINEGNDIKSASDMKSAIDSYGGDKGSQSAEARIQESCQTMTRHSTTGIQSLNNFSFESNGLRVWKA